MPLIYESCWQLGDISLCLSSQLPLLPLPRLPTSPRNVTLYKALCPLFIVGHCGDTVTFTYPGLYCKSSCVQEGKTAPPDKFLVSFMFSHSGVLSCCWQKKDVLFSINNKKNVFLPRFFTLTIFFCPFTACLHSDV